MHYRGDLPLEVGGDLVLVGTVGTIAAVEGLVAGDIVCISAGGGMTSAGRGVTS